MGQEFASSRPFLFFADHEPELGAQVREGRLAEMRQFRRLAGPDADVYFADPCDPATFEQSKLDLSEAQRHATVVELHRDLLRLRREDPVFAAQRSDRVHGAVLADEAFLLRYLGEAGDDRLLLVNLGRDRDLRPATEPLLAASGGDGDGGCCGRAKTHAMAVQAADCSIRKPGIFRGIRRSSCRPTSPSRDAAEPSVPNAV